MKIYLLIRLNEDDEHEFWIICDQYLTLIISGSLLLSGIDDHRIIFKNQTMKNLLEAYLMYLEIFLFK